jgi:pyrimidine-nucleoside phosphorylase
MSGRGLDYTGGTLDKMESIPGFRTNLSTEEFIEQLRTVGLVLTGQTADLAPADGKLYGLRDATATVQSIPLIASSIMSKKIAGGAQAIVLDVKLGLGAFMPDLEQARQLAELLVSIAVLAGRKAVALLSDMNQPLGHAVGDAVELKEAIDTLHGGGPPDFREHCLVVAGHLLALGGKAADEEDGKRMAEGALADGRGWIMFKRLVTAQGGDVRYIENPALLPAASLVETVPAPRSGYLSGINARIVGQAVVLLGGGRSKKGDPVDYAVGVTIHHKVGECIASGEPLFTIYANDTARLEEARLHLLEAHTWSDQRVAPLPLFYGVVK